MENEKRIFPKHLSHLNKTFFEELSYKLWSTKGARFKAHSRLISKNNKSVSSLAFLTAYLIIFGLVGVYQNKTHPLFEDHIINFGSLAGSILVLIFSLLEGMKDYKLNAHLYHTCALEISHLYNQLRIKKTLVFDENSTEEITSFCEEIDRQYTDILMKYPNHEDIDYKLFMLEKKDYFDNITKFEKFYWNSIHFFYNSFFYYLLIIVPPILLVLYYTKS
ncbi:MAG: SLATT domain-containing protein [Spirosomataceae bacterium]|jgi:hypothetical protein